MPGPDPILRENLRMLLGDGHAHMGFDAAVSEFPMEAINQSVPNAPYTPWHILEHMRRTQRDMLDYIRDPGYSAPTWPDDYWPGRDEEADEAAWNVTIDGFRRDLAKLAAIVDDESRDLGEPVPSNPEHTILRSLMVVAAHNHYHIGEFAALRQVMGTWSPGHEG